MGFRLIADLTAFAHFAFLVYVVFGGFLAWWRPWAFWPHLAAAVWGFGSVLIGYDCPLTHLENWARRSAGTAELPSTGFIDHYLTGVIYPDDAVGLIRLLVAVVVLISWAGALVTIRRRSADRAPVVSRRAIR
ncbi:DUF2784 domain-containing protein [Nocardia shimofusensis]|uniref:DUF2784 domain-containing protein n=1 Tax=Nocardia shimofusensis TaxID=228596 RepID=UPI0008338F1B|nr:DUF2784 domain-containing protein [Nocardia shimofusensis]